MSRKVSVFHSPQGEARCRQAYEATLRLWPVPFEEQDLTTQFGTTHLIASGSVRAEPIILLHGQDSSATSWIYNIADLSQALRTYSVDTIGDMGKSKPTCLPKSRADYAQWLLEVLERLKLQKVDLVGLSYGGFLAINFALAHPERVKRIVLLAPGIPNFGPPTLQWANYGMPMMLLPSRLTVKRFINGASTKGYSKDDPVHEQMIIGMMNLRKVSFVRPVFTDDEFKKMAVPSLLLIGDHEIMYEPHQAIDCATRLIPGLQAELIRNANHMLNSDQSVTVNQLILDFLNK